MEDWRSLTVTDSSKLLAGMTPEFEAELIEALAVCTAQITNDRRHLGYAASCAMTSMGKVN